MQNDLNVTWVKGYDGWLHIGNINLQDEALNDAQGVYIIWLNKTTVKVGSGRIRDELAKLKTDREITKHKDLMISWCVIEPEFINGVANYLIKTLKPLIEGGEVNSTSIAVNKPWE